MQSKHQEQLPGLGTFLSCLMSRGLYASPVQADIAVNGGGFPKIGLSSRSNMDRVDGADEGLTNLVEVDGKADSRLMWRQDADQRN